MLTISEKPQEELDSVFRRAPAPCGNGGAGAGRK